MDFVQMNKAVAHDDSLKYLRPFDRHLRMLIDERLGLSRLNAQRQEDEIGIEIVGKAVALSLTKLRCSFNLECQRRTQGSL